MLESVRAEPVLYILQSVRVKARSYMFGRSLGHISLNVFAYGQNKQYPHLHASIRLFVVGTLPLSNTYINADSAARTSRDAQGTFRPGEACSSRRGGSRDERVYQSTHALAATACLPDWHLHDRYRGSRRSGGAFFDSGRPDDCRHAKDRRVLPFVTRWSAITLWGPCIAERNQSADQCPTASRPRDDYFSSVARRKSQPLMDGVCRMDVSTHAPFGAP